MMSPSWSVHHIFRTCGGKSGDDDDDVRSIIMIIIKKALKAAYSKVSD
jgi:hypothetical protein